MFLESTVMEKLNLPQEHKHIKPKIILPRAITLPLNNMNLIKIRYWSRRHSLESLHSFSCFLKIPRNLFISIKSPSSSEHISLSKASTDARQNFPGSNQLSGWWTTKKGNLGPVLWMRGSGRPCLFTDRVGAPVASTSFFTCLRLQTGNPHGDQHSHSFLPPLFQQILTEGLWGVHAWYREYTTGQLSSASPALFCRWGTWSPGRWSDHQRQQVAALAPWFVISSHSAPCPHEAQANRVLRMLFSQPASLA